MTTNEKPPGHISPAIAQHAALECVRLKTIIAELVKALELAQAYVGKAHADGAYAGCVYSADRVLAKIADTLTKAQEGKS